MKASTRTRLIVLALLAAAIVAALKFLPLGDYLNQAIQWVGQQGAWGPLLVGLLYIVACVFFVPGAILTLGAGLLFGVVLGTVTVSIASVLGATAAFLIGRYLVRDWIEQKLEGYPRFHAIDEAVGKNGFKIVFLTRLSPAFPFNLLNYAFGLTRVSLRDYVLASWIGMFPGTLMYVYLGSMAGNVAELGATDTSGDVGQQAFKAFGLVVTILVTVLVTRIARKALREAVTEKPAGNGEIPQEHARPLD